MLYFKKTLLLILFLLHFNYSYADIPPINKLPEGESVQNGIVEFTRIENLNLMNINQITNKAIVNWNNFDVGVTATVNFNQPKIDSVILNRVISNNPSQIFGKINANGQVYLLNQNGIYFSPNASVQVGSLHPINNNITNNEFLSEIYHLKNNSYLASKNNLNSGLFHSSITKLDDYFFKSKIFDQNDLANKVISDQFLNFKLDEYISLLSPEVRNQGVIISSMQVIKEHDSYEMRYDNNSLVNMKIKEKTIAELEKNKKLIKANKGIVILSAEALDNIQGSIVNSENIIEATGIKVVKGKIILSQEKKNNSNIANKNNQAKTKKTYNNITSKKNNLKSSKIQNNSNKKKIDHIEVTKEKSKISSFAKNYEKFKNRITSLRVSIKNLFNEIVTFFSQNSLEQTKIKNYNPNSNLKQGDLLKIDNLFKIKNNKNSSMKQTISNFVDFSGRNFSSWQGEILGSRKFFDITNNNVLEKINMPNYVKNYYSTNKNSKNNSTGSSSKICYASQDGQGTICGYSISY